MFPTLIRLFIIYFLTVFSFRLMGKRQVGELQLSELVCAIFISELATIPVGNKSTPLVYGIIPIVFLVSTEVIISFFSTKSATVKRIFDSSPDILIDRGVLKESALSKARITVEELLSELRQQGISNISEVYYAILEANGKLSIIQKAENKPVTPSDSSINVAESGIDHALIIDGKINKAAMKIIGKNEEWLYRLVKKEGYESVAEIFLLTVDDGGNVYSSRRQK